MARTVDAAFCRGHAQKLLSIVIVDKMHRIMGLKDMKSTTAWAKGLLITVSVSGSLLAICGVTGAATGPTKSSKAESAAVARIPAGTVLHVGERLGNLKLALSLAGEDKNLPYQVQYAEFVGGPPMLQAFQARGARHRFRAERAADLRPERRPDRDGGGRVGFDGCRIHAGHVAGEELIKSWADLKGKTSRTRRAPHLRRYFSVDSSRLASICLTSRQSISRLRRSRPLSKAAPPTSALRWSRLLTAYLLPTQRPGL